ncbi:MAG TPA: hypothetical protein VNS12_07970 [Pelagibacterium sp.]|nr:hypothetical protein [Pelagibacterium sp.]HWJ87990.1 hypothetical protein [Pelagibacterium sp.]
MTITAPKNTGGLMMKSLNIGVVALPLESNAHQERTMQHGQFQT